VAVAVEPADGGLADQRVPLVLDGAGCHNSADRQLRPARGSPGYVAMGAFSPFTAWR
jgi:hypothetical protein